MKKGMGLGHIYINENCWRAMNHLVSGQEWRQRIMNAVLDIHRPSDTDHYSQWMSQKTKEAWRKCILTKKIDEMTDEEVAEVAQDLAKFLFGFQRDEALRESQSENKN
jgi:hypothetical protein